MEGTRLCQNCKKNGAVRCYEGEKQEFYCLECYSKLFLDEKGGEGSLEACPYCQTTLAQVRASKIVGCAHCYQTMQAGLFPIVQKMQGGRAHSGKTPPLDGSYDLVGDFDEEYRKQAVARTRYIRQCHELETIIKKLRAEGDVADSKEYEQRLAALKERGELEEEDAWRTHLTLSKRS